MKIAIADCEEKNLAQVGQELTTIVGESNVLVIPTDVSKLDQVVRLRDRVYEAWGEVRTGAFCWQSCLLLLSTSPTLSVRHSHVSFSPVNFLTFSLPLHALPGPCARILFRLCRYPKAFLSFILPFQGSPRHPHIPTI